ncbi:MAG: MFS transporter [Balneolaceae bacterium]
MKKYAAYGTLILLTLIYINSFFVRQIVAVLGVEIRDAFLLSNLQVGLLYGTAFSFIYAFAGIPMGRLADKTSRKWMICIGLFVWTLMTFLSGFATSFAFLITARMLVGLSQAMLSPAVYSYLADLFPPEKRATIFSLYASGIFLGIGSSFLIGGTIANEYDWQTSLIAVSIPGLLLLPLAIWFIKEPKRKTRHHSIEASMISDLLEIVQKRTVQYHLVGFSLLACTGYTILAFAGTIFNDVFNRPDLTPHYGWFIFGVGITVILSGRIADYLAKKNPSRRFMMGIVAALAGLPFYGVGFFTSNAEVAFILIGIGVLFSSSYNGVAAALIQYFVTEKQRALAGGLYLFVISIAGFGLGPPVAGWMMDSLFAGQYAASKAVFFMMIICSTGSTIAFLMAMKTYSRDMLE